MARTEHERKARLIAFALTKPMHYTAPTQEYRISWKKHSGKKWKTIGVPFKEEQIAGTSTDILMRGFDVKIKPKGKKSWIIKSESVKKLKKVL